jgi:hypothetical protein
VSLDRLAVERRLGDRNREDEKQAKVLIGLGIPFALASFVGLMVALSSLLWILRLGVGCFTSFFISGGVALAAMVLDTLFHRSEYWHQTQIYQAAAAKTAESGGEPPAEGTEAPATPEREASDFLENLRYAGGKALHLLLGGPRNIRKGIDLRKLILARSEEEPVGAGTLFLQWLRQRGRTPKAELEAAIAANPRLSLGYTLTTELGLLEWKTVEGRKVVDIRPIQGIT